jgi:hypothetical protein
MLPEPETFKRLTDIKKKDFTPELIPESVKAVMEIMVK